MAPFFATLDRNRRISDTVFWYFRCGTCGLISLLNAPQDLSPFYSADYYVLPTNVRAIEKGAKHDRHKIDLIRQYVKAGRLLEIGPSWGAFCLLAKRAGFAVEAIEMDPHCCEFLENAIGVRAINSNDEVAALEHATVPDVIALWHVIEHMRNPWAFLERAAKRLAPGGIIVIATPNPQAWQFRIFGRYWTHIDAPRHLHLIPASILRNRMYALGLEEELCTTRDTGSLGWNSFGWSWSLAGLASSKIMKRALRLSGRMLAWAISPIEGREGVGSAYTAIYRKPLP